MIPIICILTEVLNIAVDAGTWLVLSCVNCPKHAKAFKVGPYMVNESWTQLLLIFSHLASQNGQSDGAWLSPCAIFAILLTFPYTFT